MAPEGIPPRPPLPLALLPLSCCDGELEESDPVGALLGALPGALSGAGDGEGPFVSGRLTASGEGEGDGDEEGDDACCGDWLASGPD
ncbi:hypothetical protein ACFVJH_24140 [Streptomyces decoyicus]|uniref:hypothetical protein n=1 Tax=Streptomyces decoyicus TaxID=249567 RepID=UPI003640625B